MSRTVITPVTTGDDAAYLAAFQDWSDRNEILYAEALDWSISMKDCIRLSKDWTMGIDSVYKGYADHFKDVVGRNIRSLESFRSDIRGWLDYNTAIIMGSVNSNQRGGTPSLTEWEDWYSDLNTYVETHKAWYVDSCIKWDSFLASFNSSTGVWFNDIEKWILDMDAWIASWPKSSTV